MIKALLLMVAQVAGTPAALAADNVCKDGSPSVVSQFGDPLKICARRQAVALERSGERADIVATAVVSKCEPSFKALRDYVEQCDGYGLAKATDAKVREAITQMTVQQVVEIRAGRHR